MAQATNVWDLRRAFGHFATGVTIVTCVSQDGSPIGLTANSFSSVSLDPPLVSFSIACKAHSCETFIAASHFAINILGQQQSDLAARFSKPGSDKWAGVSTTVGRTGCPLIHGAIAGFECQRHACYEAGDHYIIIGRVLEYWHLPKAKPLLFYGGAYQEISEDLTDDELWWRHVAAGDAAPLTEWPGYSANPLSQSCSKRPRPASHRRKLR
jgi:flavin reductase (DIM6/NTAB) family NADH-FMN oxidoreductase RutF